MSLRAPGAASVHSRAVRGGELGEEELRAVLDRADTASREQLAHALGAALLTVRERQCTIELLRGELAAMEADLRALDRHVGSLEHDRLVMEIEREQLRQRAAELFLDLERDEQAIASLRAELARPGRPGGSGAQSEGAAPARRDLWRALRSRLTSGQGTRPPGT